MGWHTTASVDDFLDATGDFLRARPVEHTVPLTVAGTLRERGLHHYSDADPIFGSHTGAGGAVDGAFLHTPPFPVLLTAIPTDAAVELADLLADRPQAGVDAPVDAADAYAGRWRQRTGGRTTPGRQSRLFRLDRLVPPDPMPAGHARVAGAADRDLLISWMRVFHGDVGEVRADVANLVDSKLAYGGLILWEVGGTPVAMAGLTRPHAGTSRVVSVFTRPGQRRRGYGGAATTAVTRAALDAGARDVVLYTDLANPTSNALYQRLGYRPVEDRTTLEFTR